MDKIIKNTVISNVPPATPYVGWIDTTDNNKLKYFINGKWTAVADEGADVSRKADKVSKATTGNLAGLDKEGNLVDSESKPSDFATAEQGGKADTAYQDADIQPILENLCSALVTSGLVYSASVSKDSGGSYVFTITKDEPVAETTEE